MAWYSTGETPLQKAAVDGDVKRIVALIKNGADVNECCRLRGWTALYHAIDFKGTRSMIALLEAGADINARDKHGFTPLHWAVRGGAPEHVTTLLDARASVEARDEQGNTPLHFAAMGVSVNTGPGRYLEKIALLLKAGASGSARNKFGETAFDILEQTLKKKKELKELVKQTDAYWMLNDSNYRDGMAHHVKPSWSDRFLNLFRR